MTGFQVILWALVAGVVIIIDGLAAAFAVIFIRSALNTSKPSAAYRSRSHE